VLRTRLTVLCLAPALVAATAAGCGGDGGSVTLDAQTYAAEVCEVALAWNAASGQIGDFQSGVSTETEAAQAVVEAQQKTVSFVSLIREVDEPADPDGQAAYASLQQTADSLDEHSATIRAEGGQLASGEQTGAEAAAAVEPQIDLIFDDLRESVEHLDAIAADTDLTAIVRADQSCQALGL